MGQASWSGPLKSGTIKDLPTANQGYVTLMQTAAFVQNSTTAVSTTFYLPANSQILDFLIDSLVAWDSAVSATLSIGITAGGTEYVGSVDMKATAGRLAPTYTGAQLAEMANIAANVAVIATVTVSGATSAGSTRLTVRYAQK